MDFDPGIKLTTYADIHVAPKPNPVKEEEVAEEVSLVISPEEVIKEDTKEKEEKKEEAKILKADELPEAINLDVPFTSQAPEKNWDDPWQDACEEAAVLMFDAYYKNYDLSPLFAKDEIIKMVSWEEQKGWGGSIEVEKVKDLVEYYMGKNREEKILKILENPTVQDIKTSLAAGHPVLAVANGKVLPNPHFRNDGPLYHALIIRGYTQDSFITNDPGTQFGKNFMYAYDELLNALADWNGGDVKEGRRVVLVLQ